MKVLIADDDAVTRRTLRGKTRSVPSGEPARETPVVELAMATDTTTAYPSGN